MIHIVTNMEQNDTAGTVSNRETQSNYVAFLSIEIFSIITHLLFTHYTVHMTHSSVQ